MSEIINKSPPAPESPPSPSSLFPFPLTGGQPPNAPPTTEDPNPSSPPSPPPPEETPATSSPPLPESPPPAPPTDSDSQPNPATSESPPPSSPNLSPPVQQETPIVSPPPEKSTPISSSPPPTPPKSKNSPPPPENEVSDSPPPPEDSPPSPPSPEKEKSPTPSPEEFKPPPNSPPSENATAAPPPAIPSTNSPSLTPITPSSSSLSPPRSRSSSDSSSSSSSSTPATTTDSLAQTGIEPGTVAGVAIGGVFLVAVIALFFMCSSRRRRRRRSEIYAAPPRYISAGTKPAKSDVYYSGGGGGQQHNINFSSGTTDSNFYGPPTTPPSSYAVNNHGSQRGHDSGLMGGPNPYFSYEEAAEMTNGFSRENMVGQGGFGCVYKGTLPDGKEVAVKQLKAGSGQGEREFKAEVEIISRVHHRHLVSLVGYCISDHHRLLIYEFVSNDTLEHHLHGAGMPVLDWAKRLKIALGAAKGLAYLHEDCHPKIIHRDIKSANILLEESFEAQVADFGLAKPSNDTNTHVSTRVMGTFGYMAPEYASSGKLTDKSDVFSFGVVLLELITGRKSVDPTRPLGDESLVEWARPHLIRALESGDLTELVDPRLENNYIESEMTRMVEAAAACVRHSAPKRPRMVQVARALDCEGEMSDLSNGVKYGQSTIYESGQYNQDMMKFRRMALGDSSEYDKYSGEFGNNSREAPRNQSPWNHRENSSGESETRAFNSNNNFGAHTNFGNRRF